MEKLIRQKERELLSAWEGWHCDYDKGGGLDPELCAKARREEVEYIRRLEERGVLTRNWKGSHQDRVGGQPGKPNVRARWVSKEYKTHARAVCVDTAIGSAESRAV